MFVGSYQLEDKVLDNIRHFLDIDCLDHNILKDIISQATELKASKPKNFPSALGKTLALIFEKPSTRTRVSFEVGMLELGGNVVILNDKKTQLSRGETVADTSRLLSRYANLIMLRTNKHKRLNELAGQCLNYP
jgi:Ornithine carbamoyltransferase